MFIQIIHCYVSFMQLIWHYIARLFQLHTLFDGQPSSRLVDGKKSDLNIYNSQCTSTLCTDQ